MSRLGLLEGMRVRRLGNPFINPADFQGPNPDRAKMTTDWPSLFATNPANARSAYDTANAGSLDPEFNPTVESFMSSHGQAFQADPPVLNVPVYSNNPPLKSDAEYQVEVSAAMHTQSVIDAANAARTAVTSPANIASTSPDAAAPVSYALPLLAAIAALLFVKG